jgi:hypothetical protein
VNAGGLQMLRSDDPQELQLSIARWLRATQLDMDGFPGHSGIVAIELPIPGITEVRVELFLEIWKQVT